MTGVMYLFALAFSIASVLADFELAFVPATNCDLSQGFAELAGFFNVTCDDFNNGQSVLIGQLSGCDLVLFNGEACTGGGEVFVAPASLSANVCETFPFQSFRITCDE